MSSDTRTWARRPSAHLRLDIGLIRAGYMVGAVQQEVGEVEKGDGTGLLWNMNEKRAKRKWGNYDTFECEE